MGQCCQADESAVKVEELKNQADQKNESSSPAPIVEAAPKEVVEEPKAEAAPSPEPEQEAPPKVQGEPVVFTFEDAGTTKDITLEKGPLGMSYKPNVHPVVIDGIKPGGNAEKAGIKTGMKLVKIDGADMLAGSFATADKAIKDAARKTVMTFDDAGASTEITLRSAPLGISYKPNVHPIVVDSLQPSGVAEQAGVKTGMKLVKLDGEDMVSCDFATADAAIKGTSKRLAA